MQQCEADNCCSALTHNGFKIQYVLGEMCYIKHLKRSLNNVNQILNFKQYLNIHRIANKPSRMAYKFTSWLNS